MGNLIKALTQAESGLSTASTKYSHMVKFLFYLTIGFALVVIGFGIREFRIQAQQPVSQEPPVAVSFSLDVPNKGSIIAPACLKVITASKAEIVSNGCETVKSFFTYNLNSNKYEECLILPGDTFDCKESKMPAYVANLATSIKPKLQQSLKKQKTIR